MPYFVIYSSKKKLITIAAAPASVARLIFSSLAEIGEEETTSGFFKVSLMQEVCKFITHPSSAGWLD